MNERFALHTRSASFALTLSSPMVDYLLWTQTVRRLAERFPWYRPGEANFSTAADLATQWINSTVQGLHRRGLVEIVMQEPPVCRWEMVRLARSGELVADLLVEAGFTLHVEAVQKVPLHPDDRIRIYATAGGGFASSEAPPDRRADAAPEDVPFLAGYRP